jgi:hypothetical protein
MEQDAFPVSSGIAHDISCNTVHTAPPKSRWARKGHLAECPGRINGFDKQNIATLSFLESLFMEVEFGQ